MSRGRLRRYRTFSPNRYTNAFKLHLESKTQELVERIRSCDNRHAVESKGLLKTNNSLSNNNTANFKRVHVIKPCNDTLSNPQKDDNNNQASRTINVFNPVKGTLKIADDRINPSSALEVLLKCSKHIMSTGDIETNDFNLSQQSIDGKMPSSVTYPQIDDSNISSSTNMDAERTNSLCFKPSNVTLNNTQNRIRCSYSGNSSNPGCFYKDNGNMKSNDTKLKFPSRKRCVLVSGIAEFNSLNSATRIERELASVKPYLASLFDHNERHIVSNISIVADVIIEQAKEVLLQRGKSKQMNFRVSIFPGRSLEERIRMKELKEELQTRLDNAERNIRIQDFRIIHEKRKRWKHIPIITL
ncbi:hypothetical protein GJ496_006155 [Pomphorhynchus laevis]|nr:hypothetical protein GJ496_006155 [Pomphorhynchus laevis]